MNVLAKVPARQLPPVEKRSNIVAPGLTTIVLLVVLVCTLAAGAFMLRPSLVAALVPERETSARRLDEAIGATVEPLDPGTARSLGLALESRGLVVTSVASGGPAARAGVRTGDVVVGIEQPVGSMKDLTAGIRRNGNALTITLNRHGQSVILLLRAGSPARPSALVEEQEWR